MVSESAPPSSPNPIFNPHPHLNPDAHPNPNPNGEVRHGIDQHMAGQALHATASTPESGFEPALAHLALYTGLPPIHTTMECMWYGEAMRPLVNA